MITYSMNVFIPLTHTCLNRCAYCGFRSDEIGVMSLEEVEALLVRARRATEALLTFGDNPSKVPGFAKALDERGYVSFIAYVRRVCELAISHGFIPHTNAGLLKRRELKYLKPYNGSMGLMLETTADLPAHIKSPSKNPKKRLRMIKYAGSLEIPFTTGILVGIGESWDDREESLFKIAELHERYNHIQEVIIQGFSPKRGTPMENHPPPSPHELLECVRLARACLPDDVAVQVPPNLIPIEMLPEFIKAGACDIGGISEITPDYINPEAPWPDISELKRVVGTLRERLCIHPKFVLMGWYGEKVGQLVERLAGEDGLVK